MPLLIFTLCLIAALTAFNTRTTHVIEIDLPVPRPEPDTRLGVPTDRLVIDRSGRMLWNGTVITRARLAELLAVSARDADWRRLEFMPDPDASYGDAFAALGLV